MLIRVADTQTANELNGAMTNGNCIVLYHMHGCPYCVQMMPEWTNFTQVANKQMPELTIGEVEREHMDKLGDTGVSSFPTIKFYKAGEAVNNLQPVLRQNTFKDVLQNIMNNMKQNQSAMYNTNTHTGDNSVMFEDERTTNKLIQFAKNNLIKDVKAKGKKGKQTQKKAQRALNKAKKTKKALKATKKGVALGMNKALAKLAENELQQENSNMMDLPKYKKSKKQDSQTAKKIKKAVLG